MYFPKSAFRPRIMSPSHGGRLHCLVRGLSNSFSWKGLLTYISGSTVSGLLYDWVSSSDIWTLKATCNYISIHFWINSILKSEGFTISWNINLVFFTLVELTFLETPKTECCAYFFQVAKLVILDDCVMKNAVFQIMVCDVSLNVTVLKRTATISMDVVTGFFFKFWPLLLRS